MLSLIDGFSENISKKLQGRTKDLNTKKCFSALCLSNFFLSIEVYKQ